MLIVDYQKLEPGKVAKRKAATVEFSAMKWGKPQKVFAAFNKDKEAVFYMWQAIREVASGARNDSVTNVINCAKEFLVRISYKNGETELYKFRRK